MQFRIRGLPVVALCAGLLSAPASAQERLIGLLTLPEVFGVGPCDRYTPSDVPLYTAPGAAAAVGSIRVDKPWTHHADGGCEGLQVRVHLTGWAQPVDLATREFEYEMPAVLVVQQQGRWFRVRVDNGTAWLQVSERDEFHALERLLMQGEVHLTSSWDGLVAAAAGGARSIRASAGGAQAPARVIRFQRVGDALWAEIALLSHSECESTNPPAVKSRGWVDAHDRSGVPTVWFSARGC